MKRQVNLHIGELVLHGFAPGDRRRIGAAVQAELEKLIREQGIPQNVYASASISLFQADAIHLRPGSMAGKEIGRTIYRTLAQPRARSRGGLR